MNESAASPSFEAETYYELRSRHHKVKIAGTSDEFYELKRGDIVLCASEGTNAGQFGVFLFFRDPDGEQFTFFHRTSRFRRGAGNWRAVNPMVVIAKADQLP